MDRQAQLQQGSSKGKSTRQAYRENRAGWVGVGSIPILVVSGLGRSSG